ncbi:helix-turn-helix domain-containing protein [Bacillus sp. Marseille-P3661]|uniref:helix-turn-helix domain-containing protein n=1 Tax=Bacillus sp. Marseille-P3661 TaxID=1936234 RepID=UPI000C84A570|nr:helix-turn-helix domain-containing protein [Bacillus sp. Marseille-P3661]
MKRFRQYIILKCISQIQGERSIFGIYHLLQGKRSSQTIQDAKLFNISYLFQSMQYLSKEDITSVAEQLVAMGLIIAINKDTYVLTETGYQYLEENHELFSIPDYLNGWKYSRASFQFWKRYSLTIQSLSCLLHEKKSFIPIINDEEIQEWVKRYLKKREDRIQQSVILYNETETILKSLPSMVSTIFVLHLTGAHRVGYTFDQISSQYSIDEDYAWILFQSAIHYILGRIEETPTMFPELYKFTEQEKSYTVLTHSSQKTYQLLLQGKSLSDIMTIRQLKLSTIEDHLVEIASEIGNFSIDQYVDPNLQEEIINKIQELNTKRLKPIKDALNHRASYFQIRLTLARGNF